MQAALSPATATRIRQFLKPLADAGAIPPLEFDLVARSIRDLTRPTDTPPPPPAALLTLATAAERLACSKKTVSRLVHTGRLAPVYLTGTAPKSLRVRASEVAALVGLEG